MKRFFDGVRRHIGKLDAEHLREQYEKLSDETASLDTIFRTITIGIVVIGPDGRIAKSNPAAGELLGMDPAEALPVATVRPGEASKREIEVAYPQRRILELQSVPLDSGALLYIRDVTAERERTQEELRAGATRAVRDLAAGVAHEIGNPLNALSLNLQLLDRESPGNEEIIECLRQVKRLDGIIRGFLQALRPVRPKLSPGSIAPTVEHCISAMKNQLAERGITVTLDLPGAIPSVAIDENQMEQVFFNLVKNSMEALKTGGKIEIAIDYDDNDVIATVSDNGPGMTQEQVAHVFEPYRTSKEHGSGLGLMISSRIVREHGGTISTVSAPGQGASFSVRLPRIERRIRALKG